MLTRAQDAATRLTLTLLTGLTALVAGAAARRDADPDHDRGDVPGWVMITLMTARVG